MIVMQISTFALSTSGPRTKTHIPSSRGEFCFQFVTLPLFCQVWNKWTSCDLFAM